MGLQVNRDYKYENMLNEDLAVWFGTKKKPKGSKQPKGPWVNICRKKEGGGHPPCGRPDADSKGYPKCRAAGVASKMTDSQKKAACSQKRREEKKDPKIGKGNKPTMVSYKQKSKKNENRITESDINRLVKLVLTERVGDVLGPISCYGKMTSMNSFMTEPEIELGPSRIVGYQKKADNITEIMLKLESPKIYRGGSDTIFDDVELNIVPLEDVLKVTGDDYGFSGGGKDKVILHYNGGKRYFCRALKNADQQIILSTTN